MSKKPAYWIVIDATTNPVRFLCQRCGEFVTPKFPTEFRRFIDIIRLFEKLHRGCEEAKE